MKLPDRVQLSRRRGAKLPPNTLICDRRRQYGNKFKIGMLAADLPRDVAIAMLEELPRSFDVLTREQVVSAFEYYLTHTDEGRDLLESARKTFPNYDHIAC